MVRACVCISAFFVLASGRTIKFHPSSVEYKDLLDGERFHGTTKSVLERALGVDGIVAVKIPGFSTLRTNVMKDAYSCIARAPHAQSANFPDGTVRHTLAAVSKSGAGHQRIDHGSETEACRTFEASSLVFRETVGSVADIFGKRLSNMLELDAAYLLQRAGDAGSYQSFEEVMNAGERVEHFHNYHVPPTGTQQKSSQTIDFHVDQGLFIVFAPAILVDESSSKLRALGHELSTGAFTLQIADNNLNLEVEFPDDSLIIVAGDAVNQFINKRHLGMPIHAPQHAFRMPQSLRVGVSRVWYGMMQLPPADAMNDEVGLTFGEIRQKAADMSGSATALGCSRKLSAHEVSNTCKMNQIYCWFRCTDFTDDVNPTACAAKNMGFNCTNQFDQIYLPKDGHGDYNPTCTNSTSLVEPRPPVIQPQLMVDSETWEDLIRTGTEYAHRVTLVEDETYFLWSVTGDGDEIKGQMVHKGLVGWMAIGIERIGGHHNGMNGGKIVMGHNDLELGLTVDEYKIHEHASAFRHWKTPKFISALKDASMTLTAEVSMMQFRTKSLYGENLNITQGSNRLIWGLTHNAYTTQQYGGYAAYHTSVDSNRSQRARFRGKVHLDFQTGNQIINHDDTDNDDEMHDGHTTHTEEEHETQPSASPTDSSTTIGFVGEDASGATTFHIMHHMVTVLLCMLAMS